jgi:hypothetical protein
MTDVFKFSSVEHNLFLGAFCELKLLEFELYSLIWKLYLWMEMGMLFWEIYGEIVSCMIC